MQDGLSDNRVTCFYKDRTGFMWIGTKNGLNRYDGHRIRVYRPTAGNSISNEVINDVAEDSKGNLWVATMDGLNVYSPSSDRWESILPQSDKKANDIPSNLIWDIHVDERDRVWIASDVREFSFYNIATKTFSYFDWPAFVRSQPLFAYGTYNSIKRFVYRSESEILLASNKALVKLNPLTKRFTYLGGTYRSDVWDLRYDETARKAYASIANGKLLVWDEMRSKVTETAPTPTPYPSAQFIPPSATEIWLAAETGLLKINPTSGGFSLAHHVPQLTASVPPGGAAAVLQGADGVWWVGTSNGVHVYDRRFVPTMFLPLVPVSDKESSNGMGSVWFDRNRNVYFVCATEAKCIFVIDRASGAVRRIATDASGRPLGRCNTVKADRENRIWLLTDAAVYRYDDAAASFRPFATPAREDVVFRDMVQDAEGNYWFASFHKGIYYYRNREKRFELPPGEGFDNLLTSTAVCADEKQRAVWIGTYSIGFYRYDLQQKKLHAFLETADHPEYASLNLVNDVVQASDGSVWAATRSGGLFRFLTNANGQTAISRFSMKTGLVENSYAALCAVDTSVWALSGNGLTVFNRNGDAVSRPSATALPFSAYLSDPRFPHKMVYNKEEGEVLVAVGGGLLLLRTAVQRDDPFIPVVITAAAVNDLPLPTQKDTSLASSANNLTFSFASLYYGQFSGYVTEFRLEGSKEEWRAVSGEPEAIYGNLAPGVYRFHVRVRNAAGKVLGSQRTATMRILPPVWQRWWAIGIMSFVLLALVYAIFKRRESRIRKQAAVRQQLAELEGKALRAQMNPHFIFNCLNAIQELIVTENVEAAYGYLSKFSKLLRLVLNNSEKPLIPLSDELQMLQLYLELESLRFKQSFSYQTNVDREVDEEEALMPPLLLQPFLENAIWHGLMLKEGEKTLRLHISQKEERLVCVVEDNGIGRQRAGEIKAQKIGAAQFDSKGLRLSQQRLSLVQDGHASAKIEDLYEDGVATGTRVTVTLPLKQRS